MEKKKMAKALMMTAILAGGITTVNSMFAEAQTYIANTSYVYKSCVTKDGKAGGQCSPGSSGCLSYASCS